MTLAKIFQAVEETRFLKKLSSQDRLFFIGESEILAYIQNFFNNQQQLTNNHYYDLTKCDLNDISAFLPIIEQCQAIIIVSFKNEASLFEQVKQKIIELELNIPILRLFADIFINLLCHKHLLQPTLEQLQKPEISYAILTTPRSGSTYLCDLLDSTQIAGHPSEHLRLATQELARHCNFDYLRLLHNLMHHRITDNGVFGTKFISHFLFELQHNKLNFKQIFKSLDKFILLIRKDKVAQAVSLVVAQQTEIWHIYNNNNGNNLNYQSKLNNIVINDALLEDVEQKYVFINKQEEHLKRILANNQIEPLEVFYEDIVANSELQIDQILGFLKIAKPQHYLMKVNTEVKKMPSNISQEIIRQFKQRKAPLLS
ncbi:MAG: Stf0 family sulfotransferase [Waterburya sp.]